MNRGCLKTQTAKDRSRGGFSLVEVMIAAAILVFAVLGLTQGLIYFGRAGTIAHNKILALGEAQTVIEEIRNTAFQDVFVNYGAGEWMSRNFSSGNLNGTVFIRVDNATPRLLAVEAVPSWESVPGRVVGGEFEAGIRMSPAALRTLIAEVK